VYSSYGIDELQVPNEAILKAYIFPICGFLLSISHFDDIGYLVIYFKDKVSFKKDDPEMFFGLQDQLLHFVDG
jgi:hypothetical protein